MYRSVSTNRLEGNNEGLPLYEQQQGIITPEVLFKKEKSRSKFSERAVHLIPFVLVFCALVLWSFSNPGLSTVYAYNYIHILHAILHILFAFQFVANPVLRGDIPDMFI